MKKKTYRWLLLLCSLTLLSSVGFQPIDVKATQSALTGGEVGLKLLNSSQSGVSFRVAVPWQDLVQETIQQDGITYTSLSLPGWERMAESGRPALPFYAVTLGVPFGSDLTLKVTPSKARNLKLDAPVVPGLSQALEENPFTTADQFALPQVSTNVEMDQAVYAQAGSFPGELAKLSNEGELRGQRLAAVSVYPIQYDPLKNSLIIYEEVTVEVQFSAGQTLQGLRLEEDAPVFESMLADTLLNYAEARFWRQPAATLNNLTNSSPTWEVPSPAWKVAVRQEGFYQLSRASLQAKGFPVDTLTPANIQMFNRGQEVALKVELDASNHVESIIFYAQAIDSKYTDQNVYWLTVGTQAGLRMTTRSGAPSTAAVASSYIRKERFEVTPGVMPFYLSGATGSNDLERHFMNLLQAPFNPSYPPDRTSLVHTFTLASPPHNGTGKLIASLFGNLSISSIFPDHHVEFYLNNVFIGDTWFDGRMWQTVELTIPAGLLVAGENTIRLFVPNDTGFGVEVVFVDWLRIEFPDTFYARDEQSTFSYSTVGTWRYQVSGFTTSSTVDVYDITNPLQPIIITGAVLDAGTLTYQDEVVTEKRFHALGTPKYLAPIVIAADTPSALKASTNQADLILISHANFMDATQQLATYRTGKGVRTFVADVQDVYDEFNYGIISPYAIRDFLAYTQTKWQVDTPAYVLLVGDGHRDPRNIQGYNQPSYIPPFLMYIDPLMGETAADNRYVSFDGEDDLLADMMIGRFPVNSNAEAAAMVAKIIAFEALEPGSNEWLRQVLMVADSAAAFANSSDFMVNYYIAPNDFAVTKVYRGVSPNVDPVVARAAIQQNINDGKLFLNYTGHGTVDMWSSDPGLLRANDVPLLNNDGKPTIALGMTCMEGYFIFPYPYSFNYEALAEVFTRKPLGGALASWSASGLGVATGHFSLNAGFYDAYFNDGVGTLGEATAAGKLALWETGYARDLLDTYHLFGDPSIVFKRSLTAVSDDYPVDENDSLSVPSADGVFPDVLENDINPDGLTLIAELVPDSGPYYGTLDFNADGSFTYTPNPNWYGLDRFFYRAVSGTTQSNATMVDLFVRSTNLAPVAMVDSYTLDEDSSLSVLLVEEGVLENDTDADVGDLLTAKLYSTTKRGTLQFHEDGTFNYYPYSNVNGTDNFTYRAYDGEAYSGSTTVTLNITPVNDEPIGVPNSYTTLEGQTLFVPAPGVLDYDFDPDGNNPLTVAVGSASAPLHGTLALETDGSFTYSPVFDYTGEDSFTYRATDGEAESTDTLVTITVEPRDNKLYLPLIMR